MKTKGVAVVADVLSEEELVIAREEMWKFLEDLTQTCKQPIK